MGPSAETAVREQAAQLATAWSGAGAPASWSLTGALFATLRDDPGLQALAARIDPDRLPALLFVAAVMALLQEERPEPLARVLPVPGAEQPAVPSDFAAELRAFCADRADALLALAASHRYQMSEPARCAHLLPAVAAVAADAGRPLALVDIGTGAGFALHLDAYRYSYDRDDGDPLVVGAIDAPVTLHTTLRGSRTRRSRTPRRRWPCASASIQSRSTSAIRRCARGCARARRRSPNPWRGSTGPPSTRRRIR